MALHDGDSVVEKFVQTLNTYATDNVDGMSLFQLDCTQAALISMLRTVNLTRNTRIPINTVNKDIVYHIFIVCVWSSSQPIRQALDLSHVCHHWRQLTLGWPVLWSSIDLRYYHLTKLCLERSAMAPVDLVISDRPIPQYMSRYYVLPEWRRLHPLIPQLIPRLRSLTIHIDDPIHKDDVLGYFRDSRAPLRLQELDVHLPHVDDNPVLVPDCLLNVTHPPRILVLQRVVLQWSNPPVHNLTRISLIAPGSPPTLQQLMDLLAVCPGLEDLEMRWIFPPAFPPSNPFSPDTNIDPKNFEYDGRVLELPRLWKLTIALVTSMCLPYFERLVKHIHAPALRSLFLDSPYYDTTSTTHPFKLLPEKPPYPFETLKHVHITQMHQPPGPCVLKGRRICDGHSIGPRDESEMDIFIRSPVPTEAPSNSDFLLGVLKSMHALEHLELYVDAWSYLLADSGIDLFGAMPNLTVLEISGEQASVTDAAMVWDRVATRRDLPLKALCLRQVQCQSELAQLVAATDIRLVHLDQCTGVDAESVAALRAAGVQVHWSEEMSVEEMAALWGDSWAIHHGIWSPSGRI